MITDQTIKKIMSLVTTKSLTNLRDVTFCAMWCPHLVTWHRLERIKRMHTLFNDAHIVDRVRCAEYLAEEGETINDNRPAKKKTSIPEEND